MGMAQYAVFRSPSNFKDPEIYYPERWLDNEGPYANDRREALQPFSFGPRNCIGRKYVDSASIHFVPCHCPSSSLDQLYANMLIYETCLPSLANIEMRLILAKMLFHFDFELTPECANWPKDQFIYTSWEKIPLMVNIKTRAAKA